MARPETFTDAAFLLFPGPLAQRLKKLVRWLVPACFGAMLAAGDALHAEMDPQVLDRYRDCGMLLHLPTSRGTMPLPQGMPFGAGYWVVRNSRGGWAPPADSHPQANPCSRYTITHNSAPSPRRWLRTPR